MDDPPAAPHAGMRYTANAGPYVCRFELSEPLDSGGSAEAKIVMWVGPSGGLEAFDDDPITVHSAIGGWNGEEGDRGLALYWPDAHRFETLPVSDSSLAIVRFRLDGTLTLGGSAAAHIRRWNADDSQYEDGEAITVKDYFGALGDPGEWQAPSGYFGFAVKLTDLDEYQILYMETPAQFVAFTTTGAFSSNQAPADITSFWRGRADTGDGYVYDRLGLYGSMPSGSKGIASWDNKLERYQIIDMGRGTGNDPVLFYLDEDLDKSSSAQATLRVWNGGTNQWEASGGPAEVFDSSDLGPAKQGDFGVSFLSAQSGRQEIIALEGRGGGPEIVRFKLYEALALGGSAAAKIQVWDGAAYQDGDEITVVDYYGSLGRAGKFQGPSGYYGYAVKLPDRDQYQILDLERIALFIEVTLDEDMGETDPNFAAATVDATWEGEDVPPDFEGVADPLALYGHAQSGDRFLAVWDDATAIYKIIDGALPKGAEIVRFKLYAALALGGAAAAKIQVWNGAAYVDGADITVVDYYGSLGRAGKFQGPSGFYGFAVKLADREQYQIIDLERIALFIAVTLDEDMGETVEGIAEASVDTYWEGQQVPPDFIGVVDSLEIYGHLKEGAKVLAVWDDSALAYKIIDARLQSAVRYCKTTASHTLAGSSKSNDHYVRAIECDDAEGTNPHGDEFDLFLPSHSSATDPNVDYDVVLRFEEDPEGRRTALGDYLDDARGMIKIWGGTYESIPHGWGLCDGSVYGSINTPDLRARFVLAAHPGNGENFDGSGGTPDVFATGGKRKHKHPDHPEDVTGATSLSVLAYNDYSTCWGQTYPTALSVTTNMTGMPFVSGETQEAATGITIDTENLEIGETHLDIDPNIHLHDLANNTFSVQPGGFNIATPPAGTGYNDPALTVQPEDHTHDWEGEITVDDPKHKHAFWAQVEGITFSPDTVSPNPHTHLFEGVVDPPYVTAWIEPDPHYHSTPKLKHEEEYHIPPYYALCYIMRVS